MRHDRRRITLIARHPSAHTGQWDEANPTNRLIFVDALPFLRYAIDRGINELAQDVERVIIYRTGTALQYLEALTSLPPEFLGDVLFVLNDGRGFLSSTGRGGDRVLYSLSEHDVHFYLQTNGLAQPGVEVANANQKTTTFEVIKGNTARSLP